MANTGSKCQCDHNLTLEWESSPLQSNFKELLEILMPSCLVGSTETGQSVKNEII